MLENGIAIPRSGRGAKLIGRFAMITCLLLDRRSPVHQLKLQPDSIVFVVELVGSKAMVQYNLTPGRSGWLHKVALVALT